MITTDRITLGYQATFSSEVAGLPANQVVKLSDVKEYIGVSFAQHDNALNSVIRAVTAAAEKFLSVTLIESRDVFVRWQQLYDMEVLPYQVIDGVVTVNNLDGSPYEGYYTIESDGGLALIKGDFPNGVALTYRSIRPAASFTDTLRHPLVMACAAVFENQEASVMEQVRYNLKGIQYGV